MRDVTGHGCNFGNPPLRDDLPLHDMTGGSAWLAEVLVVMYPDVDTVALQAGATRSRMLLKNAASLVAQQQNENLLVTVTNHTGHKLPTGYPEGRRVWLNVKYFDDAETLLAESGAYDPDTGVLDHDHEMKIYEVEPGMGPDIARWLE